MSENSSHRVKIKEFIKQWNFLIILYLVTLAVVLFFAKDLSEAQLQVGDVSNRTYKATRDIENEVATKRNQELAKAEVNTVYIIDEPKTQEIYKRYNDFFAQVSIARSEYSGRVDEIERNLVKENRKNAEDVLDASKEQVLNELVTELTNTLNNMEFDINKIAKTDLDYIINMPKDEYLLFKGYVEQEIKTETAEGISQAEYNEGDFYKPEDNTLSIYETMLVNNVLGIILEPNLSVDVEATSAAMDRAVDSVPPVMYLKGQTIVNDGDVVNEEQLQVLMKLNLVGSIKDLHLPYIVCYALVLALVFVTTGLIFLKKENEKFLANNYKLLFLTLNVLTLLILVLTPHAYVILSPIFILVFIVGSLFNNFIAIFVSIVYAVVYVLLDQTAPEDSLFLLTTSIFTSVVVTKDIKRFRLVKTTLIVSVISGFTYLILKAIFNSEDLTLHTLTEFVTVTLFVLASMVFANGIIPFFEVSFNLLTNHRLEDLISQDNPIFKRMMNETPGTLHHSAIVANLCEAGAVAINANEMLAKVYGYYHDIGKLSAPNYFIENQMGYNYHDELEYVDSARIIKNHVDYGIEIRKEYKLPKFLDDAILSHHGTSIIQYFYRKAQAEDMDNVDIEDYTYNGYIPKSKELTILMIADIVEAGVRSMISKAKDIEEIENFIDKLIDGKINEGQFDESELTFSDISKVKEAFMSVIKRMYHNRISYTQK